MLMAGAGILTILSPHASLLAAPGADIPKFKRAETPTPLPPLNFQDAVGATRSLRDFPARLTVLNFWATWCAPCVKEMPSLDRLQTAVRGDDIRVLALSQDRGGLPVIEEFYRKTGLLNLDRLVDKTGGTARAVKLRGLPTTLVIDAEGREIGRVEGDLEWDAPDVVAWLKRLAAQG